MPLQGSFADGAQTILTVALWKGVRKEGGLGLTSSPPWAWYFTKTLFLGECIGLEFLQK